MRLPDRRLVLPLALLALIPVAACGSSGDADGSGGSGASDGSSSSAVVEKYFHATVTAGENEDGYMGGSQCTLTASEGGTVLVQTTPDAESFLTADRYAEGDPVKVTASGATRGGILLDNGSGTVYVVKGKVGVVVTATFVSEKEDVTPATDADGQALAAELVGKL